jgi:hypothetical protein
MATSTKPRLVSLDQPPQKRPATPAERSAAYRARKKAAAPPPASDEALIPPDYLPAPQRAVTVTVPAPGRNTSRIPSIASAVLTMAALALAGVGISMNGYFARSLGATESAGYLFLAIGVAADCVALVIPSCAATAWQARRRATALAGWAVWLVTFAFAVTAGIGFASVNITDVTMVRASRVTPAVTMAEAALGDAMQARDRECKGGIGRYCREREASVSDRRQALDLAMASVAGTADPQTQAAVKLVSWVSLGAVHPAPDDFAMLRLMLLALLPQVGGILLMIARKEA